MCVTQPRELTLRLLHSAGSWRNISVALFDHRFDGTQERSLLSICLPGTQTLQLFSVTLAGNQVLNLTQLQQIPAISATSIRATRLSVWDLLVVRPDHSFTILTHGTQEISLVIDNPSKKDPRGLVARTNLSISQTRRSPVGVQKGPQSSVVVVYDDSQKLHVQIDLIPRDKLTLECLDLLSLTLPSDMVFRLHHAFLLEWSRYARAFSHDIEFSCFVRTLYNTLGIGNTDRSGVDANDPWTKMAASSSHHRFREDVVLRSLKVPTRRARPEHQPSGKPHPMIAPLLFAFQNLGESLRLVVDRFESLLRLAPVICQLALHVRPEWADYWRRLVPDALPSWPTPSSIGGVVFLILLRTSVLKRPNST